MIKFIHTGDIHLGLQFKKVSFDKDKAMDRRLELWSTFQKIVEYSIENQVDFLFIAGDLFEADYFTLGDIRRVRDILAGANKVNVLISAGNHDNINQKSLYNKVEWSSNVTIFGANGVENKSFENLNTNIYGYSWDRLEFKENLLFKEPLNLNKAMNNILIIHGDISKESKYLPITLNELIALDMDYIALGHIHKPNIFTNKIAYCGCPEPLDFGETGERGIIEGTIENGFIKTIFKPFSKRSFYEVILNIDESLGYLEIIDKIKNIDMGNPSMDLYRIKLRGYIQKDIELTNLSKELENNFYYFEFIDETTPDYDLEALEESNRDNIIGQYIKNMKEKGLDDQVGIDALYYGLEALLKDR